MNVKAFLRNIHTEVPKYVSMQLADFNPNIALFNYTRQTQFDKRYNELTIASRGVVIDLHKEVVLAAAPFKFFNYEELGVMGIDPQQVMTAGGKLLAIQDKLDGSLGIVWYDPYDAIWRVSTRGSFNSEMAIKAMEILSTQITGELKKGYTYCVEIIYPENRIVVDYGDETKLVLHTIMNNDTYKAVYDDELKALWKYQAKEFPEIQEKFMNGTLTIEEIKALDEKNQEGFVFKFENWWFKLKFETYCALHYFASRLNKGMLLSELKENDLAYSEEFLKGVPDEFDEFIREVKAQLQFEFDILTKEIKEFCDEKAVLSVSLKEIAQTYQGHTYLPAIFSIYRTGWDSKKTRKILISMAALRCS